MSDRPTDEPLPMQRISLLWACDYYDGPLNGMCLVGERMCWFDCRETSPSDDPYEGPDHYLYELTDEELRNEVTEHILFETYVGTHWCYHASPDGRANFGGVRDRSLHPKFYGRKDRRHVSVKGKTPFAQVDWSSDDV